MTSIDAVTIIAQEDGLLLPGRPTPPTILYARPSDIEVGRWDAGILSLDLPDGDRRRVSCPDVDEAVHEAALTWNTAEGFVTLDRRLAARRDLATWTGERRHEWQTPKQLVALVRATLRQAVKDGVLPKPDDYRVTWRKDEQTIYIRTHHVTLGDFNIDVIVEPLLRPFTTSTAMDYSADWFVAGIGENWEFGFQVEAPTEPLLFRYLESMVRAGFSSDDVEYAYRLLSIFATPA
jgi:hypothetical protein